MFTALLAADPPPKPDAIAKAVRDLGADDYHARETATAWLWAAGPAVEDALKAGLKSPDAEVVARCRDLLDKIPYGITPDMPRRFVELIAAARTGGPGGWPSVAPESARPRPPRAGGRPEANRPHRRHRRPAGRHAPHA